MMTRTTIVGTILAVCGIVAIAATAVSPDADADTGASRWKALHELQQLQANFHGSITTKDIELLRSLWAEDATVSAAGSIFHGPDEIVGFFSTVPFWGTTTSLAPSFKTEIELYGDVATLQFECVIVHTGGLDPLATPLAISNSQNGAVEIVQHSTASCVAVKEGGDWKIQLFEGSAGPKS